MITLFLLALLVIQQAPAVGGLSITVLDRATEAPLADTAVWIVQTGGNSHGRTVRTGPTGVVVVDGLPAGRYIVQVSSDTHLSHVRVSGFNVPRPDPRPEMLVDIQAPGVAEVTVPAGSGRPVVFRLGRGSEIAGRVVVGDRPAAGVSVELLTIHSETVLGRPIVASAGKTKADTDGYFRFAGLPPNTYLVRAHPDPSLIHHLNTVYYPGVLDVNDATRIVAGATTRDELLFRVELIPAVPVLGRVVDIDKPTCRELFLRRQDDDESGCQELIVRRLDEDTGDVTSNLIVPVQRGNFEVPRMGSGVHGLLYTRRTLRGGRLLAAAWQVIHVGGEPLKGIELRAQPAGSMSGTFHFSDAPTPATLDGSASVFLRPTGAAIPLRWGLARGSPMNDAGAFRIEGIVGEHAVDVNEPVGWIVDAVLLADGQNILDRAFAFEPGRHYEGVRVVLSDRVAAIRGTVPAGGPRNLGMVVAFPEDEALRKLERYVRRGDIDDAGNFTIRDVRPGTSYLVGVCGWPCISGYEAENLDELAPAATRVYVDRPGTFSVDLKR
ncbi:MAG: carboxypeptidase-like regulatory domain-containing protein [Vicinamibacterales bacterium]